jgi:putative transposase
VRRHRFATCAEADRALFEYFDKIYNLRRIQKNLGWRFPDEFEAAHAAGGLTTADLERLAIDAARRRRRAKRVRPSGRTRPQRKQPTQRVRTHGKP